MYIYVELPRLVDGSIERSELPESLFFFLLWSRIEGDGFTFLPNWEVGRIPYPYLAGKTIMWGT